ncbi:MAG: 50S ribosomal protein L11 methyltransferase [Lysobacterales bacterium]|nr:MAG: 50S ribosomal protein L11 methyltransferase [Xanthomonadales bacterium]
MPQTQLTIDLGAHDPGPIEEALFELGAVAVTLEDAADDPVLEPAPGETPLWPTVRLHAIFEARDDARSAADEVSRRWPDLPPAAVEGLPDKVWEREWLKDFRPMRFGRRLWVCPGGLPAGDPEAVRIELDPGLAFGTGTHPTTALCLEWLDAEELTGARVADYGCGSGILAIAAARLGASHVIAMDIDPQALLATRENAVRNGVAHRVAPTDDPALPEAAIDVLVANILAGPLVALAPLLAAALRTDGRIALSGLLAGQADAVTAAYRPWFDIRLAAARDGWALLAGRRRAD